MGRPDLREIRPAEIRGLLSSITANPDLTQVCVAIPDEVAPLTTRPFYVASCPSERDRAAAVTNLGDAS